MPKGVMQSYRVFNACIASMIVSFEFDAAVELHDGATYSADDIIIFVKQHLDSVKAPKMVHVTKILPRSAVGKLLRRAAKDLFG